jgi:hypothetical protein
MIDVARWLWQEADPGRWTRDDLEAMCTARGWRLDGEQVRTGLPTGDGLLRKAPDSDTYISMSLPLSGPHADAATASNEFRRAGNSLRKQLGESTAAGHSILLDDLYEPRSPWGGPFRQWRGPDRLLDLRFEDRHVAIALQQREVVEQHRVKAFTSTTPHHVHGFFLALRDERNTGLNMPGGWLVDDWELLRGQLARLLSALPTTTAALGTTTSFRLFLTAAVGKTAWVDVLSRDRMRVYGTLDLVAEPASLGWQPNSEEPDVVFGWRPFQLGRNPEWVAPEEADGTALADLIVNSALAAGITDAERAAVEFLWCPERYYPRMYGLSVGE